MCFPLPTRLESSGCSPLPGLWTILVSFLGQSHPHWGLDSRFWVFANSSFREPDGTNAQGTLKCFKTQESIRVLCDSAPCLLGFKGVQALLFLQLPLFSLAPEVPYSLFPTLPLFTSVVGLCMTLKGLTLFHFNFLKVQQGRQQVLREERDSVRVPGLSQCPHYLMVVTKKDSSYDLPKTYSVFPKHGSQMVKLLPQTIKIVTTVCLTNYV